jgi:hypothetical protein
MEGVMLVLWHLAASLCLEVVLLGQRGVYGTLYTRVWHEYNDLKDTLKTHCLL